MSNSAPDDYSCLILRRDWCVCVHLSIAIHVYYYLLRDASYISSLGLADLAGTMSMLYIM